MEKIDYKKELKHLYNPSAKEPVMVEVPVMDFLMIDGTGDPNTSQEFQDAVEALYSVSYTLKFMIKKGKDAVDYGVMPLEGLWWVEDMSKFSAEHKEDWSWTVMIMQPELITRVLVEAALKEVEGKKKLPALSKVRFESYNEGPSAQVMHIGSFSEEGPTIVKLHDFIKQQGRTLSGKHHEIYLSDIRRAAPEKWKTIIRQPVEK